MLQIESFQFSMQTNLRRDILVPVSDQTEPLDGGDAGETRLQAIVANDFQASTVNITQNTTIFRKTAPVKSFCTVQAPTDDFQGRIDLLRTIHEKLQIAISSTVCNKLALVGSRGMGKSELARKFVATL